MPHYNESGAYKSNSDEVVCAINEAASLLPRCLDNGNHSTLKWLWLFSNSLKNMENSGEGGNYEVIINKFHDAGYYHSFEPYAASGEDNGNMTSDEIARYIIACDLEYMSSGCPPCAATTGAVEQYAYQLEKEKLDAGANNITL